MEFLKKSKRNTFLVSFTLMLAVLLLTSCAKQNLTSSWINTSLPEMKMEDVLVIGLAKHPTTRNIFENAYVEDLEEENVKAFPSHKVAGENLEPTREALLKVIRKTDAKTVLITRLVNSKKKTLYQDAVGPTSSSYEEPYGAFFQAQTPQTSATKIFVYLESNLYDVQTEQLIWSATAEAKDPVMTKEYMKRITNLFIKDLKKARLL